MTHPTSPDSRPDPVAIDLDWLRGITMTIGLEWDEEQRENCFDALSQAIAAVEALRAHVAELEGAQELSDRIILRRGAGADAVEATAVDLAEALEWALDTLDINDRFIAEKLGAECDRQIDQAAKTKARTTLAAMPADALERAKARDEVVTAARFFMEDGVAEDSPDLNPVAWQALGTALANLDALDSVQRGIQAQEFFGEPEGMATHEQSDLIENDALNQGERGR